MADSALAPHPHAPHSFDLLAAAKAEMVQEGFHLLAPGSEQAAAQARELDAIQARQAIGVNPEPGVEDLRSLPWSSIDNDTSRDLDQIEWAQPQPAGSIQIAVAIADVAEVVQPDSAIDQAAAAQSLTVYTAAHNFPMLPNELSTGLTSLNPGQDRRALVYRFTVTPTGELQEESIQQAVVRNSAQLAYSTVGAWLTQTPRPDGRAEPRLAQNAVLAEQIRLQKQAADWLRASRVARGALDFQRGEADPVVVDGRLQTGEDLSNNPASQLIAELMVAANETMARTMRLAGRSTLRRVVRTPARWDRMVALAALHGTTLPDTPDALALSRFLTEQRAADPVHYPDLALAMIKLLGAGEYVLAPANAGDQEGHFGLATHDYTHSTAPNRRYPDLIVQRLVKAWLAGQPQPYTDEQLAAIAQHANERDRAARKVERAMRKREMAVVLAPQVGQQFQGVVTAAKPAGTYVRIVNPPVEGRIVHGAEGLDVGDKVTVTLTSTDPLHAYIDFAHGA